MTRLISTMQAVEAGKLDSTIKKLYGSNPDVLAKQAERYLGLIKSFNAAYPGRDDISIFSTPGRTEVGGNHTDHNAGRVLAAAVDMDIIAVAAPNDEGVIRIQSEGFPAFEIRLDDLAPVSSERYTSQALVRGVCARLRELGYRVGGYDACFSGNVPKGSGLSSSAAYEVLAVTIENWLYNDGRVDDVLNAKISQYAENNYFGKPCGLMDQTTCAVGGFVTIDFRDFGNPIVKKVEFDFASCGYTMVIVDTGGNHADLNEDYADIAHEMKAVAKALGGKVLRDFSAAAVHTNLRFLRTQVNDRAILRALHFYADDNRVAEQVKALEANRFGDFLEWVVESGVSSWMLCQNCYSHKNIEEQGLSVALAASESLLKGRGAWRVHGGGFAGTIQAFVPNDLLPAYRKTMRDIYGEHACHELLIRPVGTVRIEL